MATAVRLRLRHDDLSRDFTPAKLGCRGGSDAETQPSTTIASARSRRSDTILTQRKAPYGPRSLDPVRPHMFLTTWTVIGDERQRYEGDRGLQPSSPVILTARAFEPLVSSHLCLGRHGHAVDSYVRLTFQPIGGSRSPCDHQRQSQMGKGPIDLVLLRR
jgi:hypothetical protein